MGKYLTPAEFVSRAMNLGYEVWCYQTRYNDKERVIHLAKKIGSHPAALPRMPKEVKELFKRVPISGRGKTESVNYNKELGKFPVWFLRFELEGVEERFLEEAGVRVLEVARKREEEKALHRSFDSKVEDEIDRDIGVLEIEEEIVQVRLYEAGLREKLASRREVLRGDKEGFREPFVAVAGGREL